MCGIIPLAGAASPATSATRISDDIPLTFALQAEAGKKGQRRIARRFSPARSDGSALQISSRR